MKSEAIFKAKGKTVTAVVAWDPFGYDQGFELEFSDGTILEVWSEVIKTTGESRIFCKIKED